MSQETKSAFIEMLKKNEEAVDHIVRTIEVAPREYFWETLNEAYDDDFKSAYNDPVFKIMRKTLVGKQFEGSHIIANWLPERPEGIDINLNDVEFYDKIREFKMMSKGAAEFYRQGYSDVIEILNLEGEDGARIFLDDEDKEFVSQVQKIIEAYREAADSLSFFDENRAKFNTLKRELGKAATNSKNRIDNFPDVRVGLDIDKAEFVFASKKKLTPEQLAWNKYVNSELMRLNKKATSAVRKLRKEIAEAIDALKSEGVLEKAKIEEFKKSTEEISSVLEELKASAESEFNTESEDTLEKMKIRELVKENHETLVEANEQFIDWIKKNSKED